MLSYQHGYHAGNLADVHKHRVLAGLLEMLTRKARPITYMDTHAGRGVYDLAGAEARKTGEAAEAIGALGDPGGAYGRALAAVRGRAGADAYPGSPLLAAELLRPGDRMVLMELHPQEHTALRAAMAGHPAEIHRRDGYAGAIALSPPKPRRGLVLVDPSYEIKTDYRATAEFARAVLGKWPEAVVMIWYPLLDAGLHRELIAPLAPLTPLIDEVRFGPSRLRMRGSGLVLLNAPYGAAGLFAPHARLSVPAAPAL